MSTVISVNSDTPPLFLNFHANAHQNCLREPPSVASSVDTFATEVSPPLFRAS